MTSDLVTQKTTRHFGITQSSNYALWYTSGEPMRGAGSRVSASDFCDCSLPSELRANRKLRAAAAGHNELTSRNRRGLCH